VADFIGDSNILRTVRARRHPGWSRRHSLAGGRRTSGAVGVGGGSGAALVVRPAAEIVGLTTGAQ
jgi:hypothetical protein